MTATRSGKSVSFREAASSEACLSGRKKRRGKREGIIQGRKRKEMRKDETEGTYWMSQNKFSDLSCYFRKSLRYFIKITKEIYYTMLNLDLSICFISVSTRID